MEYEIFYQILIIIDTSMTKSVITATGDFILEKYYKQVKPTVF